MIDPVNISLSQQLSGVMDVLAQRQRGYPKLVARGKLRQSEADYRIAQIQATAVTLTKLIHDLDFRARESAQR